MIWASLYWLSILSTSQCKSLEAFCRWSGFCIFVTANHILILHLKGIWHTLVGNLHHRSDTPMLSSEFVFGEYYQCVCNDPQYSSVCVRLIVQESSHIFNISIAKLFLLLVISLIQSYVFQCSPWYWYAAHTVYRLITWFISRNSCMLCGYMSTHRIFSCVCIQCAD